MRKFTLLSLLVLGFLSQSVNAQTNPTRVWGTYYADASTQVTAVAADKWGNVYMTGYTTAGGKYDYFGQLMTVGSVIATPGSFQDTLSQGVLASYAGDIVYDAFLVKFNSDGVRQWATYYGGTDYDMGSAVACDTDGNVYMAGGTQSTTGIASPGSFQSAYVNTANEAEGFLVKFDSSGARQWATYYGSTDNQSSIAAITFDQYNHVYIAGSTSGTNGISSTGGYQPAFAGGYSDGFLAKFTSDGIRQWGTYYGDTLTDGFSSVVCDAVGNVYAAGQTTSLANIATPGSNQPQPGGGTPPANSPAFTDGFLVKFSPAGQRIWGTYYGGNQNEEQMAVAYDKVRNGIYLAGITSSANNISTPGSFQEINYTTGIYDFDAFLTRFDTAGTRLWGTYYGGAAGIEDGYRTGLGCDISGNVYMTQTVSTAGTIDIATPGSYQDTISIAPDIMLIKFGSTGNRIWGTYFGSTGGSFNNDYSFGGLACDGNHNIYFAGGTTGTDGIATPGSFQDTIGAISIYPFLEKFHDCLPDATINLTGNTALCAGDSIVLRPTSNNALSYQWQKDGAAISGATDTVFTVKAAGAYQLIASNGATCLDSSIIDTIIVHPAPVVAITATGNVLHAGSFVAYQWYMNGQSLPGATDSTYTVTQTGSYTVTITDTNGCIATSAPHMATEGVAGITQQTDVTIYPNPANDLLYINAPAPVNITVYDIEGKLLFSKDKTNTISVSALAQGTYIIRIADEAGNPVKTGHFVKL